MHFWIFQKVAHSYRREKRIYVCVMKNVKAEFVLAPLLSHLDFGDLETSSGRIFIYSKCLKLNNFHIQAVLGMLKWGASV